MRTGSYRRICNASHLSHDEEFHPKRTSQTKLKQKKVMLSMWWDWKGVVFFELLSRSRTTNQEELCRQLNSLSTFLIQNRPERVNRIVVVFQHIFHERSTYLPQLAPSDFHLFRCLQNSLNGVTEKAIRLRTRNNEAPRKTTKVHGKKRKIYR